MKKIAVIVTARASWSKLQPVCEALRGRCELQIIACASALLERYGNVSQVIRNQNFNIAAECWTVHEGENLLTSAKETGALLGDLATRLDYLRPECVVVCADRHEVLAAAQSAAYLHIRLAHLQGGEVSGSIDDKVRNAVTMLADVHFPATLTARALIHGILRRQTGHVTAVDGIPFAYTAEQMMPVYHVGCPSIDLALRAQHEPPVTAEELGGAGPTLDLSRPFGVVLQHPVTHEVETSGPQMVETILAMEFNGERLPWVLFWPGEDAGASAISKTIRLSQSHHHTVRNLPPSRFLRLLTQASVLVGNSSAGIRECSALGVPVVNVGSRQMNRERGPNVIDVPHDATQIAAAIRQQVAHGRYEPSSLYGDGDAGAKIAEVLCLE
jgi:UDP-N-acetylglucosamine 2-epimerase